MNPSAAGGGAKAPDAAAARAPIGLVVMNLGGPDSLDDVEPFLRRLFGDPDVIQLGWLSFLQPLLARAIAKRRGPLSRAAYQQIGGRSPIRAETTAQADAVAAELARRGVAVKPVVAMAAWHPFANEALGALGAEGIDRAVALPLYPHESRATTGSSLNQLEEARAHQGGIEIAAIKRYPDADGYVRAVIERFEEAVATLPAEHRQTAPVLFSAHGLPEAYIKRGDPYLDDVRITVETVTRRLGLGPRARLCFQSRVGPQRWLGPTTEAVLDELAAAKTPAVVVVPIAFTGEHIETLQEIDILYKERAQQAGIVHFARARTVGCHPAFIAALADLVEATARARGWA
jgi:ferrochelatase